MDWQVKTVSGKSSVSERPFVPGQEVFSFLLRGEDGALERMDIHADEREELKSAGELLGWWRQTLREKQNEAQLRRLALETSEGLFVSLFEPELEPSEDRDMLKFLLAIVLERKRVIKPVASSGEKGFRRYRMAKTDEIFEIPEMSFDPVRFLKIQDQLTAVVT